MSTKLPFVMPDKSTPLGDHISKLILEGKHEEAKNLIPTFDILLKEDMRTHQELLGRLDDIETWMDEQKAKAGSKDPSRSALHAHLDEVLDSEAKKDSNPFGPGTFSSKIHKFFRSLV